MASVACVIFSANGVFRIVDYGVRPFWLPDFHAVRPGSVDDGSGV